MFKYFKEMRELKKTKLTLQVLLLGKLDDFTDFIRGSFDGTIDTSAMLELAKGMQGILPDEFVKEIVKNITANEAKVEE